MNWQKTNIKKLLQQNFQIGGILFHLGVDFEDFFQKNLEQICQEKNISFRQIQKTIALQKKAPFPEIYQSLQQNDLLTVLKYLRNSHRIFLQEKLPYLAHLIEKKHHNPEVKDLQLLFPLFAEEFIIHIHQEEEGIFQYLDLLSEAKQDKNLWGKIFILMKDKPLEKFLAEHHDNDDEMRGIREFTKDYALTRQDSITLRVLYAELQSFERELQMHALIEDEILIPKSIDLESSLKKQMKSLSKWN